MNNSGLHCECPSYSKNARATNIKSFSFASLKGVKVRKLQLLLICKHWLFIQQQEAKQMQNKWWCWPFCHYIRGLKKIKIIFKCKAFGQKTHFACKLVKQELRMHFDFSFWNDHFNVVMWLMSFPTYSYLTL